jgi:hypothetical protein
MVRIGCIRRKPVDHVIPLTFKPSQEQAVVSLARNFALIAQYWFVPGTIQSVTSYTIERN